MSADGFAALPFDANWLAALTFLSLTSTQVGAANTAGELWELLLPYRDRVAVLGAGAACLGPVSHVLGLLAAARDDSDSAVEMFEQAAATSRGAGSEPWLARADCRLGLVLAKRGVRADRQRSEQLLAESSATARRLGMGRLLNVAETATEAGSRA
jgi:hypothetical protein